MRLSICLMLLVAAGMAVSAAPSVFLTRQGRPAAGIYLPPSPPAGLVRGATEVQEHIRRISGALLPIRTLQPGTARFDRADAAAIIIADDAVTARRERRPPLSAGEYVIRVRAPKPDAGQPTVEIIGSAAEGALNGCYGFLEEMLGCRWYTASASAVQATPDVRVPAGLVRRRPAFAFREVYYAEAMDPTFAARHRLNGNASLVVDGKMKREEHRGWGYWCHTFFTIVPPARYFGAHPEYFAEVNGKRVENSQLCLTNPDVLRITVEHLREQIRKRPDQRYWSVSQNDTGGNCQCPACRAIDEREGSPMGSLLAFVNRVASRFPDRIISTLSYQYTRRPPATLRPAPNVQILLCSIECNRSRPIAADPTSASFRSDVQRWAKLTENVFIWDYVIQFANLVSPFPNLRVLQPDIRFFAANHARGLFAQGNREVCGEFADLRAYLLAKLAWDPNIDVDATIDDFVTGYYGPASPHIRRYIDLMQNELAASGAGLSIFGGPRDGARGYLSEANLALYGRLFDEAEKAAAASPDELLRVRAARMPIQYAQLQLRCGTPAERRQVAARLFETASRVGLRQFAEWGMPVAEYRAKVEADLNAEAPQ